MAKHPTLDRLYKYSPKLFRSTRKNNYAAVMQANELLYERLFSNALPRFGVENRFYPVKSAATYSLLYLILRIVTELPVKSVLELGAGQTSLLLDGLAKQFNLEINTVEHDHHWMTKIQRQVAHTISRVPLVDKSINGYSSEVYDFSKLNTPERIDFMVIDGPIGRRTKSRWGCLALIPRLLADDFVLIFDDAERKGELETIEVVLNLLEAQGLSYSVGVTESVTSQVLIAGGRYAEAAYY